MHAFARWLLVLWLMHGCRADAGASRPMIIAALPPPPLELPDEAFRYREPAAYAMLRDAVLTADDLGVAKALYLAPGGVLVLGRSLQAEALPGQAPLQAAWSPARVISLALAQALQSCGITARVLDRELPLSPSRPAHVPAWRDAVQAWYESEQAAADYRRLGVSEGAAIVELGIREFSLFHGQIRLALLAKRIDLATGRVQLRAHARETVPVRRQWRLLAHRAEELKAYVRGLGQKFAGKLVPPLTAGS